MQARAFVTSGPTRSAHPSGRCRASFSWRGRSVSVTAPDQSFIDRVASLLGLEAGQEQGGDQFEIRADPDLTLAGPSGCEYFTEASDLLATMAVELPFRFLDLDDRYVIHAGAIVAGGKAHLFLGPPFVGKSTIALEAWLMGYKILGDDYVIADAVTGLVEAFPKPLKLRLPSPHLPARLRPMPPDGHAIGRHRGQPILSLFRTLPRMVPLCQRLEIGAVYLLRRAAAGRRGSLPPAVTRRCTRYWSRHWPGACAGWASSATLGPCCMTGAASSSMSARAIRRAPCRSSPARARHGEAPPRISCGRWPASSCSPLPRRRRPGRGPRQRACE